MIEFFKPKVPIFHMASFSRSGETVMLRCLAAHPQIKVVHQIVRPDTEEDFQLFSALTVRKSQNIRMNDPVVRHKGLKPGNVLVVKNATWTHAHPRRGFVLIRNPFSLVVSSYRDDQDPARIKRQRDQQLRWARKIDPASCEMMEKEPPINGFLALYAHKMLRDRRDGLPFVRYEEFVQDPERWLRKIVAHLKLDWDDNVLRSHEGYKEGQIGHGGIRLWEPINAGSLDKYKQLSQEVSAQVYSMTSQVLAQYGYEWDGETLTLRDDVDGML